MTLYEFADKYKLAVRLYRTPTGGLSYPPITGKGEWAAYLSNELHAGGDALLVRDGVMFGHGATAQEAVANYTNGIVGKMLGIPQHQEPVRWIPTDELKPVVSPEFVFGGLKTWALQLAGCDPDELDLTIVRRFFEAGLAYPEHKEVQS